MLIDQAHLILVYIHDCWILVASKRPAFCKCCSRASFARQLINKVKILSKTLQVLGLVVPGRMSTFDWWDVQDAKACQGSQASGEDLNNKTLLLDTMWLPSFFLGRFLMDLPPFALFKAKLPTYDEGSFGNLA